MVTSPSNGAVWSKLLCLPLDGNWTHISNIICLTLPLSYQGIFLFGSLDDISITHSIVKVNRLMIFFSLARRVGFEPTDAFASPVFRTGAFSRSAISAYYWPNRKDSSYGSLTSPLPYHLANFVYLIGASVRWKHLYLRSCAEAPPTTGYVTFFVP